MPTFTHDDPRFEPVEYEIKESVSSFYGKSRYEVRIVIKCCDGSDHATPRVYSTIEGAEKNLDADLGFIVKYWGEQLDDRDRAVVCNGTHYRIGAETKGGTVHSGFGGSQFKFRDDKTGEVIVSTNTWYQGVIPEFAREAFPDTHGIV